ncbi:hypothetical protein KBY91_19120 [Streptomyces sp. RK23]|uniref:hypothetical protein n=1 Tax=unclassified Streptomyces TaxID=2593676 RepID=UPI001B3966A5|nr:MULTISPECIES: hypothetical protein [unclassified Streptomyces]MBQ0963462.1 hypothetical protein [Streptomyces sp. RK74B]MBQ1005518.1 hypothetical protein [Streptomyces sp. RK23]
MPTAEQLMAAMRGDATRYEVKAPEVDATTLALARQGRGDTDYSYVHEANRQGQAEYERAIRKRASELRAQGVHHPESTARMELQMAAQSRKEQAERRAVHEAMTASNRAEMEANSTPALRERVTAATKERREERAQRQFQKLLAEIRADMAATA